MHWVLIYWITTGSPSSYGGLHTSTASVVFDDEAACQSGFAAMQKAGNRDPNAQYASMLAEAHGICVPQASDGAHR